VTGAGAGSEASSGAGAGGAGAGSEASSGAGPSSAGGAGAGGLPDPATFLSGAHGTVGGKRGMLRRAADRALDAWLAAGGSRRRVAELAARTPPRDVLVAIVHLPDSPLVAAALGELRATKHRVRIAAASTAELTGGKLENVNRLLAGHDPADWTFVIDDDVVLPSRFLDGFVALAEAFEFELAQPAQTLASHAAWPSARRVPFAVARRTNFVEIGPVTAFSRTAADELLPFPGLRMGWGLDLHWGALAEQRGWRLGIVDALPVRHETRPVGGGYSGAEATAEARRFLAGRAYVRATDAGRTLHTYRTVPR
jgi:hypothetical protein